MSQLPPPEGSVIITPAQQYAELRAVREVLDRLVHTVDPAMQGLRSEVKDVTTDVADHEDRIRKLEYRVWTAASAVAVATSGGLFGAWKLLGGG